MTNKNKSKREAQHTLSVDSPISAPQEMIMRVIRESYLQNVEDLKAYAEKVKDYNKKKKAIREYLKLLRCVKSSVVATACERGLDMTPADRNGAKQLVQLIQEHSHAFEVGPLEYELGLPALAPASTINTLGQFNDAIAQWEERLLTLGDDAQLANVDLQNMLQKEQQALQMMSNISKMLHDSAMVVIRNFGG